MNNTGQNTKKKHIAFHVKIISKTKKHFTQILNSTLHIKKKTLRHLTNCQFAIIEQ